MTYRPRQVFCGPVTLPTPVEVEFRAAARTVATHARDVDECRTWLEMLGLLDQLQEEAS